MYWYASVMYVCVCIISISVYWCVFAGIVCIGVYASASGTHWYTQAGGILPRAAAAASHGRCSRQCPPLPAGGPGLQRRAQRSFQFL